MVGGNSKFLAVLMPFYDLRDFFGNTQLVPISVLKPFVLDEYKLNCRLSFSSTPNVDGFY